MCLSLALLFINTVFVLSDGTANGESPTAYTLTGVIAVNGSTANGGCPTPCVGVVDGITTCDCGARSTLGEEAITGVLIDGVIPTINTEERNTANEKVWAAPLFTVRGSADIAVLGFRFSMSVILHEVELYLFHCPAWGIGAQSIVIHNGPLFPQFTRILSSIGSVTLTSDQDNCDSLTRVSIPTQMAVSTSGYFVEFTNPSGDLIEWVHIAEVRFSDQPSTTSTANPMTEEVNAAAETTTEEVTTALSTAAEETTGAEDISESVVPSSSLPIPETIASGIAPSTSASPSVTESTATELIITPSSRSLTESIVTPSSRSVTESIVTPSSSVTESMVTPSSSVIVTPSSSLVYLDTTNTPFEASPSATPFTSSHAPAGTTTTIHDATDLVSSVATLRITPPIQHESFPVAIVGVVIGVVISLLVLLVVVGVAIACCFKRHRRKFQHKENHTFAATNSHDSTIRHSNYLYQETKFEDLNGIQFPPPVYPPGTPLGVPPASGFLNLPYESTKGADIVMADKETTSDIYEDIVAEPTVDSQYSTIENCIQEREEAVLKLEGKEAESGTAKKTKRKKGYSLVMKKNLPVVPAKSPELRRALLIDNVTRNTRSEERSFTEIGLREGEGFNPAYISSDSIQVESQEDPAMYSVIKENHMTRLATSTNPVYLGSYSEIRRDEELIEDPDYTEMKGNVRANVPKRHVTSGPVVLTSAVCKGLEVNPEYESADALMIAMEEHNKRGMGAKETESVSNTLHGKQVQPSAQSEELVKKRGEGSTTAELEGSEVGGCDPIYSLISSSDNDDYSRRILEFKPDNVRKVRTLGTGFFGKVILAETVGLSLKDLGMSDTDDDKEKSVRVAVKQLRQNPSSDRREAFNKELQFMSHLNHPNVIRALGACTQQVATPFIVMEYMEKGDLNQHLQDFDSIVPGNVPPTHLTISVGTLVYMSSQIADAMKYLSSRNYIHRDLATRNCLVGAEFKIKIADFGMSKNLYRSHYYFMSAHAILPIRWMAKECFYGKFSAKTDVWAFGVTLWEIFTLGKDIPYEDMDDSEVVADASDEGNRQLLKRPKDCPEKVYTTMLTCWEEEPKDRATFEKLHKVLSSI